MIKLEKRVESGHIQYKCKCLKCGLHFIVYSWYEDWIKKVEYGKPHCPECGLQSTFLLGTLFSDKHIYEKVPGI